MGGGDDTIVSLAVIEHINEPISWSRCLAARLNPSGCIVLTTPHPIGQKIHEAGALLGFFSRHAAEEHESFISKERMLEIADVAGLQILEERRFLFGMN